MTEKRVESGALEVLNSRFPNVRGGSPLYETEVR